MMMQPNMASKLLPPLELGVMNILWDLRLPFEKDILDEWNEPTKPAYNTISTTVRILQEKGFVQHQAHGRTHQYFPAISKLDYQRSLVSNVLQNAFAGSGSSLVSALVETNQISNTELDELQQLINNSKL